MIYDFSILRSINPEIVMYDEVRGAMDINYNVIEIDQAAYDAEVIRVEEEQVAREALRQSLITKLSATLTPEETALLEELL